MNSLNAVILLLCSSFLGYVHCKYVRGHLKSAENWVFLTRFCFLSELGKIRFSVKYPQEYEVENILMYFDSPGQWESVYKNDSKNCFQKTSVLDPAGDNNQKIELTQRGEWSAGCSWTNITGVATHQCIAERSFHSARDRWWYIAIANCESTKGLDLKYEIWMTNGNAGDTFFEHFSADEFYILQIDIAFLMAHVALVALSIFFGYKLACRQLFHTTYKMYVAALSLEVLSLLIMCWMYGAYANSGVENRSAKYMGRVFESAGVLTFELMLILMAKGYTITRGRLSHKGTIKVTIFMTAYIIVYVVLFVYEAFFFDPGLVLYTYESIPGYGLIALRIIAWIWFVVSIFFTLKHYPEKGKFFYPFFVFYTLWFWAGPIVILIAMRVMPPWVREKVVNGVENCVILCGNVFFLALTRPSAANTNFPYHVRTAQIAIVNDQSMADFPHNPYGDGPAQPNFTDLFVVTNQGAPQPRPQTTVNVDAFPHEKTSDIFENFSVASAPTR